MVSGRYRGKLGPRGRGNLAEALEHRGLNLLQLLSGVAILHVGHCDA